MGREVAFVELLREVAEVANQANSVERPFQACLDAVCGLTTWPLGHALLVEREPEPALVSTQLWHVDSSEGFQRFRQLSESTRFRMGVGLPGRVLATRRPAWIRDVLGDSNFPRGSVAGAAGIRGAFAFPVLMGSEVGAVVEFFTRQPAEPDGRLLEIMSQVGTQLGRVLERKRSEDERQRLHAEAEAACLLRARVAAIAADLRARLQELQGMQETVRPDAVQQMRSQVDRLLALVGPGPA
jgi:GAF domain-containing protein